MRIKFSYIILFFALIVACCAAYFSIFGLSQLFSGASVAIIIMASVLEISKIIATTALHNYWERIARGLKIYLTISIIVLMAITSIGIYGFLSSAYQKTANKLEIHQGEISILDNKKIIFEKNVNENQKIVEAKNKRIEQLSALRSTQENRLDNSKNNLGRNNARNDIKTSNEEIQRLSNEIDDLNRKNNVLSDSINSYTIKALELNVNSEVAGEIGPLKYLSELTNQEMSKIVNILILLFIFVFDPLAVALILIANRVLEIEKNEIVEPKKKEQKTNNKLDKTNILDSITKVINSKKNKEVVDENIGVHEDVKEQEVVEEVVDGLEEQKIVEEEIVENNIEETLENDVKEQPKKNRITLEDIKEIKEQNRGYSVNVPIPKGNNTIESIGSNKIIRDGNKDKVIFKRY